MRTAALEAGCLRLELLGLQLFERGDVRHEYGSFDVYRKRDFPYISAVPCIEILNSCLLYGTSACLRSLLSFRLSGAEPHGISVDWPYASSSAAQARLYGICNEITNGNAQVDSHLATLEAPCIDFLRDEQVRCVQELGCLDCRKVILCQLP
jgi:hypothetical protein